MLIGAYRDNTGASQAGAAYLFSTNGTLLSTFANPTPEDSDWFGWCVAAVGTDRVIVGGVWDNTGAPDAGSAYVYALPYPLLNIAQNAGAVSVSWVTPETGITLQQTDFLGTSPVWSNTTNLTAVTGPTNVVQQTIPSGVSHRFFHLHRL